MATSKEIANLVINKVESQDVYDYMLENDLVNDDELYLVDGSASNNSSLPTISSADNGKYLRVINGVWDLYDMPNAEEASF